MAAIAKSYVAAEAASRTSESGYDAHATRQSGFKTRNARAPEPPQRAAAAPKRPLCYPGVMLADQESSARRLETRIAYCTLGVLVVYVPAETWATWPHLTSPNYVVDVIAMLLLGCGAAYSLRRRPFPAIAPLAAAWGWSACLAWRSYFTRKITRERGIEVYPEPRWFETAVGCALIVALCFFLVTLFLAYRTPREQESSAPRDDTPH